MNSEVQDQDCAVCLQKQNHPTQLPCGHIFCFLCVKGIAIQSKKCAMCRAEIPPDYLDNPIILEKSLQADSTDGNGDYQWYYEGRNGWWKYDERSNIDLEEAYNEGKTDCNLLIAGVVYIIDLQNMVQQRRNDHTRKRRVRRDTNTLPAKGVAGIKIIEKKDPEQPRTEENVPNSSDDVIEILDDSNASTDSIDTTPSDVHNISDGVIHGISSINFAEPDPPMENPTVEDT